MVAVNNVISGKKIKNAKSVIIALAVICILLTLFVSKSFAALLENDVEVQANSELTYYLNVSYDGVDRNGVASSDSTVSEINSGYLYVEDKLPEGLTFKGFVTTEDGSFGAVKRSDGSICLGKVIDDTNEASTTEGAWNAANTEYTYHGLHYNANTRTVTFAIKNLQAGCVLTVGIKTQTPTIDDPTTPEKEVRRDFYNYATAREQGLTVNSNTVHAFMGSETITPYKVTYEYTGDIPTGAPALPEEMSYVAGTKVGVAADAKLEGYTFSGWQSADVTPSNGSFSMPSGNVVLKGSFTRVETKKVTYSLTGVTPEGYVLPLEKEYHEGSIVDVDSLKAGDVFNGYRFLGWETTDVEISSNNDFSMPNNNVTLVGRFEEVTYKVSYQFYETVLPPEHQKYLPTTKEFKPGETVTLENVIDEPTGYKFLGWYKENTFVMPEQDVVVYGEWKQEAGRFDDIIIEKHVAYASEGFEGKEYYKVGDVVKFEVIVTNKNSFTIKNVIVKEETDNSQFIPGTGYEVSSTHIANIPELKSGDSVVLNSTYKVLETDVDTVINTVSIKGALADNGYVLDDTVIKASTSFKIKSKLEVCKKLTGPVVPNTFQFHITDEKEEGLFDTWITLENDQCETIYVDPNMNYKVKEVVPQEYVINKVEGAVTTDNQSFNVAQGINYKITYTNEFRKKGFMHSTGRIVNRVVQGVEDENK